MTDGAENDTGGFSVMGLLALAVRRSLADREPLLLLSLFYAFLTLILVWPVWELYQFIWQNPVDFMTKMPPELQDGLWGLGLAWVLTMVAWCGVMVTWARITGQATTVTGGLGPLARRTLTAFWHLLEYGGLAMLVSLLIVTVLISAFAIEPNTAPDGAGSIGQSLMVGVIVATFLLLGGAFGIGLYETAQDRGRRLVRVWSAMTGIRVKVALGLILILMVPSLVLAELAVRILTGLGQSTEAMILGSLAYFVFSATFKGILSCVWVTFSGLLSDAINAPGETIDLDA